MRFFYLSYQFEFFQAFHSEGLYHWYLQDDTSFVILTHMIAEKFKFENLKWCKPVPQINIACDLRQAILWRF